MNDQYLVLFIIKLHVIDSRFHVSTVTLQPINKLGHITNNITPQQTHHRQFYKLYDQNQLTITKFLPELCQALTTFTVWVLQNQQNQ